MGNYQLAADGVEIIMSGLTWQLQKQYEHPASSLWESKKCRRKYSESYYYITELDYSL